MVNNSKCVSCGKETDVKVDGVTCCEDCYFGNGFYDWCKIHRPDLIIKKEEDKEDEKSNSGGIRR